MRTVKIKICGITNVKDAIDASLLGADAIGLVFYPPSIRYIDLASAKKIAEAIPPFVQRVGLFVNASQDEVTNVLNNVDLDLLQFHGDETPEYCDSFNKPYIKAISMKPGFDIHSKIFEYPHARGFLLDTYHPLKSGGTGEVFNWKEFPHDTGKYLTLAGGLTVNNVEQAINICRPYAVDVSGGVESSPGFKSVAMIQAFIEKAKSIEVLL